MRRLILAAVLFPAVALAAPAPKLPLVWNVPASTKGWPPTTIPEWHLPSATWDVCLDYYDHKKPMTFTLKVNGRVIKARGEVCINMPNKPKDMK